MADDDGPVELSAHALNALNEFYREQALLQVEKDEIEEDWELSQFWYDEETSSQLAKECLRLIPNSATGRIACISCPTLYKSLRKLAADSKYPKLTLFEYDNRFERYGDDFQFYDYRQSLDELWQRSGSDLRHKFDVVVADPPFLSEECVKSVAELVLALKSENGKIIFCTGVVAESFVLSELKKETMRKCENFEPRHKSKLGNEFRCYVNYDDAFPSIMPT